MEPRSSIPRVDTATAITAGAAVEGTAVTATAPPKPKPPVNLDAILANIILVEGEKARHIGQRMHLANYVNLVASLLLMLAVMELKGAGSNGLFRCGLELWMAFDFLPVALAFTGADHLKRLKGIGLAWVGAVCMGYLVVQRSALAAWLAAATLPELSIPPHWLALLCAGAAVLNVAVLIPAPMFLARADVRKAFR